MNILTFDVEEWFHILDNDSTKTEKEWVNYEYRLDFNMDRILNLLSKRGQKATFFCLGWIGRKYPKIIRRIYEAGHQIATHSHLHQLVYEQNREEFILDLDLSIKSLEDIIGSKITIYRAPGFSIKEDNKWVFEELIRYGIEIDCSIFPSKRAHGGFESYKEAKPTLININGLKIKEFPINLFRVMGRGVVFSGGGYFRLFPYWMIKEMMRYSGYVMTYFHPRDFDPTQPIIKELSLFRKFKSYYGLSSSFSKLEKLISDFKFIDISEADRIVNWNRVKNIYL